MHANIRPEARWPCCAAKWPSERREAPKVEVTDLWLTLSNGLQAIEDLETFSATACVDSTKAETVMTIVTHVEADLEGNIAQPPTWRAKCQWISCCKNTGYHATDLKIRMQGLNV
jgi:hypothetical protein